MRNYLYTLVFLLFTATSMASTCSKPAKPVMDLLEPLIQARVENTFVELELNKLRENKTLFATEALVRAKSLYLGSWPGTLLECEVETRAMAALPFLEDTSFCLDGKLVDSKILLDVTPIDLNTRKKITADWIKNGGVGSCEFH